MVLRDFGGVDSGHSFGGSAPGGAFGMLHSALQSSCGGLGSQGPVSMQLFALG